MLYSEGQDGFALNTEEGLFYKKKIEGKVYHAFFTFIPMYLTRCSIQLINVFHVYFTDRQWL